MHGTIHAEVSGKFPKRIGAKDLIISIAADIGADGATYQAIEFAGKTLSKLDIPGRMTLCNMAIEMGGKAGIVAPDKITWEYITGRRRMKAFELESDDDATYASKRTYSVSNMEPQVAVPHNVDTVVPVSKVAGTHVNHVLIGSCTNGRFEDLAESAEVLGKKEVQSDCTGHHYPGLMGRVLKDLKCRAHRETYQGRSTCGSTLLWPLYGRGVLTISARRSLTVHIEPELQGLVVKQ